MVSCHHNSCGREEKIWLPTSSSFRSEAALHPWCLHCGLVKNISDDRPYKIGYWMNVLSRVAQRFSITQCQKRLMAKELELHTCFSDPYGITGSSQKEAFLKIVGKYSGLQLSNIDTLIY